MPSWAPVSTSVTLSTWPAGDAKSTRLETRAPTAPDGPPGSSASVPRLGVLDGSRTGALFMLNVTVTTTAEFTFVPAQGLVGVTPELGHPGARFPEVKFQLAKLEPELG